MQSELRFEGEAAVACDHMHQAILTAFCAILRSTRLAPMTVLSGAALALGAVYQDVSGAHRGANACPCGWEPCEAVDLAELQSALETMMRPRAADDLRSVAAAGTA